MNRYLTPTNKSIAGYHLLMILSAVDYKFHAEEEKIIREYLAEEFPFPMNFDVEMEQISALKPSEWKEHFQFQAECFYKDSILEERLSFLSFAKKLIKADQAISPSENEYFTTLILALISLEDFVSLIKTEALLLHFNEVILYIDQYYIFTPTAFKNGETYNQANQNNGSCKIFSFAQLHQLTQPETLQCFGDFYRKEVLENPIGTDHANIRNFMQYGWDGIVFENKALEKK